jgi:hypothetical protein
MIVPGDDGSEDAKPQPTQATGRPGQLKGWYLARTRSPSERSIVSGLIAAVIFVVVDVATGGGVVSAIGLAVILGIVVAAISFAISRTIIASLRKPS